MSTKSSLYYTERWGHFFREMGDGYYYWTAPKSMRWRRLPFTFFWRWIERRQSRRLNQRWLEHQRGVKA